MLSRFTMRLHNVSQLQPWQKTIHWQAFGVQLKKLQSQRLDASRQGARPGRTLLMEGLNAQSPLPPLQENLGLAAEHGFFFRQAGSLEWDTRSSVEEMTWRDIAGPILQQYTESTDGSYVEKKESAFVWHYAAADPDFGSLQVCACCLCLLSSMKLQNQSTRQG